MKRLLDILVGFVVEGERELYEHHIAALLRTIQELKQDNEALKQELANSRAKLYTLKLEVQNLYRSSRRA